jgi:hypothetical protein
MVLPFVYTHVMFSCNISHKNKFNLNMALSSDNRFKFIATDSISGRYFYTCDQKRPDMTPTNTLN